MLLAPTDFSSHSLLATHAALRLASMMSQEVTILYAFADPVAAFGVNYDDELVVEQNDLEELTEAQTLRAAADLRMAHLSDEIRQEIACGKLPPVRFKTLVSEGFPEDVIKATTRELNPKLIVMGTRGAGKKASDMIGSVTAEILDTSLVPVISLPEVPDLLPIKIPHKIALLGEMGTGCLKALDFFSSLLPDHVFSVTIINLLTSRNPLPVARTQILDQYKTKFPQFSFNLLSLSFRSLLSTFGGIQQHEQFDFLLLPSKRKNFFARLFNPGAAHRLLFHIDIPMLVYPIS